MIYYGYGRERRVRVVSRAAAVSGETRTGNLMQLQCHAHGRCNRLALVYTSAVTRHGRILSA